MDSNATVIRNPVDYEIDWDKVKPEDAILILKAIQLGLREDADTPNPRFDCVRHLLKRN